AQGQPWLQQINLGAFRRRLGERTSTPISRTGFLVRAKAWARRDRRRIHKLFFLSYHPQKSSARGSFSRRNFNLDDHFDRPFLFISIEGKLRNQKRKKSQLSAGSP